VAKVLVDCLDDLHLKQEFEYMWKRVFAYSGGILEKDREYYQQLYREIKRRKLKPVLTDRGVEYERE